MPTRQDIADRNHDLNNKEWLQHEPSLESYPYNIQIGADNRCNLRCGFCLADAYREQGRIHIQDRKLERNPIELFEKMVSYMQYWKFLSLTGPGESLLNPKLDKILELVRAHSNCVLMLTTNGVLINNRLAEILLNYQVDEISISLDSLTKEIFEKLRVNAKFERAIGAIRLLNEEKMKRGVDTPRINLTPTFFKSNIREVPNFIDFAKDNSINAVLASPGQVYREDWVRESLLHFPGLTRKMATKAEERAASQGVRFINNLRMVYLNRGNCLARAFRGPEEVDFPTDPAACQKPWSSLYVEPDGEVRPCCYLSPIYGNLFEEDFSALWNGSVAVELRKSMIDKTPPKPCIECYEFNRHKPEIMISIEG